MKSKWRFKFCLQISYCPKSVLVDISEQLQWTESSVLKEAAMEDKKERNLSMFTVHHKQVCDDRSSSESLTEKYT